MGGFAGALTRSLGQFGSDLGTAHDINLDWRQREQAMRLANIRSMVERLMLPLQIKEIQEKLRQYSLPQFQGTEKLPGGGIGVLERAPGTGLTGLRTLEPGMNRDSAKHQIETWAASVPAVHSGYFKALENTLNDPATDPLQAVKSAEQYAARINETGVGKGTAKILGQIPYGVSDPASGVDYYADEQGRLHAPDGSPAPPEYQNLYTSAYSAYQKRIQDQYDRLAKTEGFARSQQQRQFDEQNRRLALKAGQEAVIAQNRLLDSESAAKVHTNPNDMLILENFMQLSFGQQPRGIRGSPQWFESMRRMAGGSLGQRFEGWLSSLSGGGMLGDDARDQLLSSIRMLVKNRVSSAAALSESYVPHFGVPAVPGVDFPPDTPQAAPPPPPPGFTLDKRP